MSVSAVRFTRGALVAALAGAAAACSTGGHDPPPPPPPDCSLPSALPAGQPFTVSGNVVYDFVPARYFPASSTGGLYFGQTTQRPVRAADVQVRQCGNVLAATTTDATTGHYTISFTPAAQGQISVYVLARTATPPITVVDNTAAGAIWTVAQPILSTSPTLDVHATHGWTGTGYGASRIAGPFAILDDLYTASRRLLDLPRAVPFDSVPLTINWSPLNTPASCSGGIATGCIGTSYYDPNIRQIFVLGAAGVDTDEFDREVVVHEWGHYFEDNFSRSDSPGGPHGFGDVLDPRLAFGEGYASAFAAMLLQDRIYADTGWRGGVQDAFGWDVETAPSPTDDPSPGPFSELSVIRAMWDLYDGVPPGVTEGWDGIALGLGPIYDTLVGPERTTPALTTLASFVSGLETQPGVSAAAVDAVLAYYGIGPITSAFGAGDGRMQAMYAPVTAFPSSLTVTLDSNYYPNEQPQNRYFYFTAPGVNATVSSASAFDVDLYALHEGADVVPPAESPSGYETLSFATVPGETYVVVLTGWGRSSAVPAPGTYAATVTFNVP